MAVWDLPARLWTIARKVEDLLGLQKTTTEALTAIESRLRTLEDRMTYLEASQGQLIVEAKAAAGVAATGLASSIISDVITRITLIEVRQNNIPPLLPPTA